MRNPVYEKLRERIDTYSVGMFPTESGKELKILERLFTPVEAEVYLAMTRSLEPPSVIAGRLGRDVKETAAVLEDMNRKGLTFPRTKNGIRHYAAAPFMHGFFEHQVYRRARDPELAPLFEDYITGGFIPRTRSLRTVPVMADLNAVTPVLPYDDVRKIIESKEKIGLFRCACNYQAESAGRHCDNHNEVCIAFDFYATYAIDEMKFGRWISRDEALSVIEKAEKAGLVHQTGGDRLNTECICNCCPSCCTILRQLRMLPNPSRFMSSNYTVERDMAACTRCGTCAGRCPMNAVTVSDESVTVNPDRCIGCGLCASGCTAGAVTMKLKPPDKVRMPPEKSTFMRSSIDMEKELEELG
jgi:Fe-S-cluster-containing hydrogenase component 2